jgi:polyisoprenoid-binding protein YceI
MALGLSAALALPAVAATATWQIDPNHANAQFTVRHLGISNVQGEFTKVTGTVVIDDEDISKSSVDATIDVNSLFTRVTMRDNDLKSERFFNAAQFPTLTFKSTKISKAADGSVKMTGNLTIRGVTKEVTLDVSGLTTPIQAMGGTRRGVAASTHVNRQDFGVSALPGAVGDDIAIQLDLEMVLQQPAAAPAAH